MFSVPVFTDEQFTQSEESVVTLKTFESFRWINRCTVIDSHMITTLETNSCQSYRNVASKLQVLITDDDAYNVNDNVTTGKAQMLPECCIPFQHPWGQHLE